MKKLTFKANWLKGTLDDSRETATFAALGISVDGDFLTRVYDHRSGGDRETIQVPISPLALGLAENWWALLYEARKSEPDPDFDARHRLDLHMKGYLFPPVAIWSGGEDSLMVETPPIELPRRLSQVELWNRPLQKPDFVARRETEDELFDLVQTAPARLKECSVEYPELTDALGRICSSMADPEEHAYCVRAGQLGLDPYDPDGPDLSILAEGISSDLFRDICEAATADELPQTTQWIRTAEHHLKDLPRIQISNFGAPPPTDLSIQPRDEGYRAAEHLRSTLGLEHDDPGLAIKRLFDDILDKETLVLPGGPSSIDALARRVNGTVQGGLLKLHPRQRRFHGCRFLYLGWRSTDGQETAATAAATRKQQASRAFAAELIAPYRSLQERAGRHGLTTEDINKIAEEFTCPEWVIDHQARNHGIRLRGISA